MQAMGKAEINKSKCRENGERKIQEKERKKKIIIYNIIRSKRCHPNFFNNSSIFHKNKTK